MYDIEKMQIILDLLKLPRFQDSLNFLKKINDSAITGFGNEYDMLNGEIEPESVIGASEEALREAIEIDLEYLTYITENLDELLWFRETLFNIQDNIETHIYLHEVMLKTIEFNSIILGSELHRHCDDFIDVENK